MGVFDYDPAAGEAVLRSCHPGVTIDAIRRESGDLVFGGDGTVSTAVPTAQELSIIREYDPDGFWTG
jgi:hypothetical protein